MESTPLFPDIDEQSDLSDEEEGGSRCCLFIFACPWKPSNMQRIMKENGLSLQTSSKGNGREITQLQEFPTHKAWRPVVVNSPVPVDYAQSEFPPQYAHVPNDAKYFEASNLAKTGWNLDSKVLWKSILPVKRKNGPEMWQRRGLRVAVKWSPDPKLWHVWTSKNFDYIFGYGTSPKRFFYVTVNDKQEVVLERGSESNVIGAGINTARLFKRKFDKERDILQHSNTKQYLALERAKKKKKGFRLKLVKNIALAEEWKYKL